MGSKKLATSMDPEKPEATGLTHFYQEEDPDSKVKKWKFITSEMYEQSKDSLPFICFATRHPIKELTERAKRIYEGIAEDKDYIYEDLPDLDSLKYCLLYDEESKEHA